MAARILERARSPSRRNSPFGRSRAGSIWWSGLNRSHKTGSAGCFTGAKAETQRKCSIVKMKLTNRPTAKYAANVR